MCLHGLMSICARARTQHHTSCPFQLSLNGFDVTFWGFSIWLEWNLRPASKWNANCQWLWKCWILFFMSDIFKASQLLAYYRGESLQVTTGRIISLVDVHLLTEIMSKHFVCANKKLGDRKKTPSNIVFFHVLKIPSFFVFFERVTQSRTRQRVSERLAGLFDFQKQDSLQQPNSHGRPKAEKKECFCIFFPLLFRVRGKTYR